ncbi:MAG TPA: hypothetical protein IAD13_00525, partial [Bacteroidetes bacterium]|nr:hypothetical protein [Candidatus Limimorpha avicola]
DLAGIDAAIQELNSASAALYAAQQQAAQAGPQANANAGQSSESHSSSNGKDDIQDADFEEVK